MPNAVPKDTWFGQDDVLKSVFEIESAPFVQVSRFGESHIERIFWLLIPINPIKVEPSLEEIAFGDELRTHRNRIVRQSKFPNAYLTERLFNTCPMRFVDGALRDSDGLEAAHGTRQQSLISKEDRIEVRKDILAEDLRRHGQVGLLCVEYFRFSGRPLQEHCVSDGETVFRAKDRHLQLSFRAGESLRDRMQSCSIFSGKKILSF